MEPAQRSEWIRSLFERYQGVLVRYAARITGDLDAARDAVQETFMQLCKLDPGALDSQPLPWLYAVCRNRAVDRRRKQGRLDPLAEGVGEIAEERAPSPLHVLERSNEMSLVLSAVNALPPNQQEVVRLRFQEGLSYREISRVTGLTISNVGFLIHVGIRRIRATLNGGMGDENR